jgi:hypothetical protein
VKAKNHTSFMAENKAIEALVLEKRKNMNNLVIKCYMAHSLSFRRSLRFFHEQLRMFMKIDHIFRKVNKRNLNQKRSISREV